MEEDFKSKGLKKDIEITLKQYGAKIVQGKKQGKLTADYTAQVEKLKKFTTMSPEQIQEATDLTPTDKELANMVNDLDNRNSEQLAVAKQIIDETIANGKSDLQIVLEKRQALREDKLSTFIKSVLGSKEFTGVTPKNVQDLIDKAIANAGRGNMSLRACLDVLSAYDPNHVLTDKLDVTMELEQWLKGSRDSKFEAVKSMMDTAGHSSVKEFLTDINSGLKESIVGQHLVQKFDTVKGKRIKGKITPENLRMSRNQMITAYMLMQAPEIRQNLKNANGFTFNEDFPNSTIPTTEQLIEDNLTDRDKAIAKGALAFYEKYYDRVNPVYRDRHGVDLDKWDFYSPIVREGDYAKADFDLREPTKVHYGIASPSPFFKRTKSIKPIVFVDAFSAIVRHIDSMEHYIAMKDKIDDLNLLLGDPKVREVIKERFGDGMLRTTALSVERLANGRIPPINEHLRSLEHLRVNITTATLGLKGTSAIKQTIQLLAYATHMPIKDFSLGLASYVNPLNIKRAFKNTADLETVRQREHGIEATLAQAQTPAGLSNIKGLHTISDYLLFMLKGGDRVSTALGGNILYDYYLKKTGSKEEAARQYAIATNAVATSAKLDYQTEFTAMPMIGRIANTFIAGPRQMLELQFRSMKDLYFNPSAKTAKQAAKVLFITQFLIPSLMQWVTNGFQWDRDDEIRAMVAGNLNGVFLVGDVLDAFIAIGMNIANKNTEGYTEQKMFKPGNIIVDAVWSLLSELNKLKKEDITIEDVLPIIVDAGQMTTGLPFKTAGNALGGFNDYVEGDAVNGIKRMLGVSSYIVDKNSVSSKNKRRE